jgi:hypothetical protein
MKLTALVNLVADRLGEGRVAEVERARTFRERLPLIEPSKLQPILSKADLDSYRYAHLGRGGGNELTNRAIAFFVASHLLDVPRAVLTEKTIDLCAAKYDARDGDEVCPFTGEKLFIRALTRILSNREIFARADLVRVSDERPNCADIFFPGGDGTVFSPFCGDDDLQPGKSARERHSTLHFERLAFLLDVTAPELVAA